MKLVKKNSFTRSKDTTAYVMSNKTNAPIRKESDPVSIREVLIKMGMMPAANASMPERLRHAG